MAGPQFVTYFNPILKALRELGNSGTPAEVRATVAAQLNVPDEILNEQLKSGQLRFDNRIHWGRFYLAKAGLLDSSRRGVWSLTKQGIETDLDDKQAYDLWQGIQKTFPRKQKKQTLDIDDEPSPSPDTDEASTPAETRDALLDILLNMSPPAFERLCKRLLRESGFQEVEVTGRSGDMGIDGNGILQLNQLLGFHVIFQCKRYRNSVGPGEVRNFRGAMSGRTDKGIFLTTGTFTAEARREATRDGVPPIELVDADKLISMLEKLELGLVPKTVFEIDDKFFASFE